MEWEWSVSRVPRAHAPLSSRRTSTFIRRVARFADFERTNYPPTRPLRELAETFCGTNSTRFYRAGHLNS